MPFIQGFLSLDLEKRAKSPQSVHGRLGPQVYETKMCVLSCLMHPQQEKQGWGPPSQEWTEKWRNWYGGVNISTDERTQPLATLIRLKPLNLLIAGAKDFLQHILVA